MKTKICIVFATLVSMIYFGCGPTYVAPPQQVVVTTPGYSNGVVPIGYYNFGGTYYGVDNMGYPIDDYGYRVGRYSPISLGLVIHTRPTNFVVVHHTFVGSAPRVVNRTYSRPNSSSYQSRPSSSFGGSFSSTPRSSSFNRPSTSSGSFGSSSSSSRPAVGSSYRSSSFGGSSSSSFSSRSSGSSFSNRR